MRSIGLYARVSSSEQTVEPQLHALRAYAAARGLEARVFVDSGISGAKGRRAGLDALMAACRRREVDAVACVKIDRLARSVPHLTAMAAEWEALGVDLIVLDQQLDTSTPTGRLTFHVLGALAAFERDLIRERTVAGLAAARRAGKRLGAAPKIAGEATARARRLRAAGRSLREIGRVLGTSEASVRRALMRS